ncbi:MAG: ABC transporter permease [Candidatus Diapherotrites archaeon]
MKKFVLEVFAIMVKELRLAIRFKLGYFLSNLVNPVIGMIPVFLIYYGFLHYSGAQNFADIGLNNYINFLVFGILAHAFFAVGVTTFSARFKEEKYWKTIEAIFVAPINYVSIIIGAGLSELLRLTPTMFLFLGIASIFISPTLITFVLVIIILLLMFLLCLSVGLINGSIGLSNENYDPLFNYFFAGWSLISCFIYPIGIVPKEFQFIILVNPVYHAVNFIRVAWINNVLLWDSLIYLIGFALIMPIIAVTVFKFAWKRLGVHGY